MAFEEDIAKLNEHFFFKEFTYSRNTFRPSPSMELELADSLIWLDRLAIVFQLKERGIRGPTTPDDEERWFDKKVVSLASRQIRDSIAYLHLHDNISLENHRGHRFQLQPRSSLENSQGYLLFGATRIFPFIVGTRNFIEAVVPA